MWDRFFFSPQGLQGKKRWLFACTLGIVLTLAFAPFHLLIAAVIAFTGFFLLLESCSTPKAAFAAGWWFGLGHHVTGLYWITIALGVDNGAFLWMVPFALLLLPAYLALFTGLIGWIFHRLSSYIESRWQKLLFFGILWVLGEIARTEFLYGFPWNHLGYITSAFLPLMQGASIFGVYGLSLWMAIIMASFAMLIGKTEKKAFYTILSLSVFFTALGALRLYHAKATGNHEPILVRIVQANIPQSLKWNPRLQFEALRQHIELSLRGSVEPDYIVWPETAMPYPFTSHSDWAKSLASILPEKTVLITGVIRTEREGTTRKVWNSVQAIDYLGEVIAFYDKNILVPFGEFVPLRSFLAPFGINKITPGTMDFARGEGAKVINIRGKAPYVQPLICYETIFPDFRTPTIGQQPNWLLNATNDAWFGTSTGPYQHIAMSQMRAVERGIPMIRAANTGISAAFDSYGNELGKISLNTRDAIDVPLFLKPNDSTWYSLYGEKPFYIVILLGFILILNKKRKSLNGNL